MFHEDITIWCDQAVFFLRNGKLEVWEEGGKKITPTAYFDATLLTESTGG